MVKENGANAVVFAVIMLCTAWFTGNVPRLDMFQWMLVFIIFFIPLCVALFSWDKNVDTLNISSFKNLAAHKESMYKLIERKAHLENELIVCQIAKLHEGAVNSKVLDVTPNAGGVLDRVTGYELNNNDRK